MRDFAENVVGSWGEFCSRVSGLSREGPPNQTRGWIFRGQVKNWDLASSLERALTEWRIPLCKASSIEHQTFREFRRRTREPEHSRVHEDALYCLALMQHYGAPTRLLDGTYSPFVAAAFALEKGIHTYEPVVWCFRGEWGEQFAPKGLRELRDIDVWRNDTTFRGLYGVDRLGEPRDRFRFVKAENPFYLNERLTAQQGVFLCPGDIEATFVDNLRSMEGYDQPGNIVKLNLQLNDKEAEGFVAELRHMNLSFATLFPGLDGFSRSIGQQIVHYRDLAQGRAGLGRKP